MIIALCSMVFGSFYLSYGVVMKSMKVHQPLQVENKGVVNTAVKKDGATAVQPTNEDTITKQPPQQQTIEPAPVNSDKCAFRSYPKSRLYGLHDKSQPNFLSSDATYIRGELPVILNPLEKDDASMTGSDIDSSGSSNMEQSTPVKPCFDTTSWETLLDESTKTNRLPFTDGHNPSIVSLASNPYEQQGTTTTTNNASSSNQHVRLDPKHISPLTSAFPSYPLNNLFLAVTIFGNGQCKFGLSDQEVIDYNFSVYNDPPDGKRTIIAVMTPPTSLEEDDTEQQQQHRPFQILGQTTLLLERDVKYGTKKQRGKFIEAQSNPLNGGYTRIHQEFDDPRFFFHEGRLWVLYRNGPLFGYQDQIHNPVHFERVTNNEEEEGGGGGEFVAYVKASETVRVCCGRNIALISEEARVVDVDDSSVHNDGKAETEWMPSGGLKALTWVDPVTVVDVDLGDVTNMLQNRRQLSAVDEEVVGDGAVMQADVDVRGTSTHRRLGSAKKPKSNIHGTNGYLVPLPSSGELLGIAHFHRPEHRKESNYALHGHHYTHAFFTIARQHHSESGGDVGNASFKLKRISNEFLFRALSVPIGEKESPNDGDVIQFASGLDVYGSDVDGKLVLSYGINDCEGAVLTISMKKLQQMLIEVEPGQEVVDLMRKATSEER